ncbi:MAG: hypothetical protein ACRYGP_27760 [Janthinobacterium lividum]
MLDTIPISSSVRSKTLNVRPAATDRGVFDALETSLQVADEDAVADHGSVVLDHGAAEPDDLVAEILADLGDLSAGLDEIRCHVGA